MAININAKTTGVGGLETSADNSGEINIQSGGSTVMNVTSSGVAVTGSFSQNGAVYSTQPTFRNIIINGDMRIAQRGTSVTGSTTGGGYSTVDRFNFLVSSAGTWDISQSTDVPSGQGFSNSFKLDCTVADASLSASDYILFTQRIEGQNLQHLKKGTSNAEKLTYSFWVKSAKTGTYIVEFRDQDNTRIICKSYTIDSANTWEKKTLTIDGDTTGAFDNDNATSFEIIMWLAAGSTFQSGTLPTAWEASDNADRAVGQVNLADSTSNNWYITGVQLEVGSTATEFEHLPFDVELKRCSRYYQKTFRYSYTPYTLDNENRMYFTAMANSSTVIGNPGVRPMYQEGKMRTAPTITLYDTSGNIGKLSYTRAGQPASSNITAIVDQVGENAFRLSTSSASGLTAGQAIMFLFYYTADAEL